MSLFQLISVSASGMSAQSQRAQTVVENLANAETTRTPEGGPYRRKDVVFGTASQPSPFGSAFQEAMGPGMEGVEVNDVITDTREPEKRYQPGHPDADKDGYVAFPRISPAEEMVNLMGASRGYQANVNALLAVRDMLHRSLDLLK
ncbi:MAG: flagellar basal body rod protein FlgC [Acidobacteriota bacterium]